MGKRGRKKKYDEPTKQVGVTIPLSWLEKLTSHGMKASAVMTDELERFIANLSFPAPETPKTTTELGADDEFDE